VSEKTIISAIHIRAEYVKRVKGVRYLSQKYNIPESTVYSVVSQSDRWRRWRRNDEFIQD
jgi:Mor family transcriptional regulator